MEDETRRGEPQDEVGGSQSGDTAGDTGGKTAAAATPPIGAGSHATGGNIAGASEPRQGQWPADEERRLHRSSTDRMLFGVAGGLADFFDVDSTLVRLLFVLLTFAGGSGIIAYVVLAIIMPSEARARQSQRGLIRENIADMGTVARDLGGQVRSGFGGSSPQASATPETIARPATSSKRRQETTGLILIVVGAIFLLSNLVPNLFNWGRLWPLVLIFIGLAIIWSRGRR